MPHENGTMPPPDQQHGEPDPTEEDCLPTASNWSLAMVRILLLVAVAILFILAVLPDRVGAQDPARLPSAAEQELLHGAELGVSRRPPYEDVATGLQDIHTAAGVRNARETAALPNYGDSAIDADVSFNARLRFAPNQATWLKQDNADGAVPCSGGGCQARVPGTRGICDRTHAVQQAILARIRSAVRPPYSGDCRGVTDAWLARLKSIQLVAPDSRVESLKPGDFAGLSNVRQMFISHQPRLSELPTGVFDGLTGLEELWMHQNKSIAALPARAFRGLPRLRVLSLNGNGLTNLEPGAFEGLQSLESLILQNNRLSDFPFDEFEALPALTHLYLSENPGYRWGIDASDTSVELAPGQSATYWLRLTAKPCIGGTEVETRWRTLGWGVEVGTPEIAFKQHDWFRSQPVTIAATADAGSQARVLVHEVRSWCYRQQMDVPPPTVMVSVSSRWQQRFAAPPPAKGAWPRFGISKPVLSFTVNPDDLEPSLGAADPAAPAGDSSVATDDSQIASTLSLTHGGSVLARSIEAGNGTRTANAEMYRLSNSRSYREPPITAPLSEGIGAENLRNDAQFVGYGRTAARVVLHHL